MPKLTSWQYLFGPPPEANPGTQIFNGLLSSTPWVEDPNYNRAAAGYCFISLEKWMVVPARLTFLTKPAIVMKTKIILLLCGLSFLGFAQTGGVSVGGGVHASGTSGGNQKIRSTGPGLNNPNSPNNPANGVNPNVTNNTVNPNSPNNPNSPFNPNNPNSRLNPNNPDNPNNPNNRLNPGNPDNPNNPNGRLNPNIPNSPNSPLNPDNPKNPNSPLNPNNPDNPNNPNSRLNPNNPNNPDNPNNPMNPNHPNNRSMTNGFSQSRAMTTVVAQFHAVEMTLWRQMRKAFDLPSDIGKVSR